MSFMKMQLKTSSAKWRQFCPGGCELKPMMENSRVTSLISKRIQTGAWMHLQVDTTCGLAAHYWFGEDVIKWKHFPRYWPFWRGIFRSPVDSAHKDQLCGAFIFSLICTWTVLEQTIETPMIWDAITIIMMWLWWLFIDHKTPTTANITTTKAQQNSVHILCDTPYMCLLYSQARLSTRRFLHLYMDMICFYKTYITTFPER